LGVVTDMRKKGLLPVLCLIVLGLVLLVGCAPAPVDDVPEEVLEARDIAIDLSNQDGIPVPQDAIWTARIITMLPGYTAYQFSVTVEGVKWTIDVGYPVVLDPIYDVSIYRDAEQVWSGEIE